jgi:hypothetical protein
VYCGFSVHGASDLAAETAPALGHTARREAIRGMAFEEARLTSLAGGNCLRIFYTPSAVCAPLSDRPLGLDILPRLHTGPWHLLPLADKIRHASEYSIWIWKAAEAIRAAAPRGDDLGWDDLGAYFAGLKEFNQQQTDPERHVHVLLTAVIQPPRPIIELPADVELAHAGLPFKFTDAYGLYCQICADIACYAAARYIGPADDPIVIAFEICNEPDYEWLPDELRLEKAEDPAAFPLTKYITELHWSAIPDDAHGLLPAERAPWGGFREQSGNWPAGSRPHVPVLEFDWGEKFNWYVSCFGVLNKHVSFALKQVIDQSGASVDILGGSVTHNNIDYLIRVHRQVPDAFNWCSGLAVHPYHWPEHDIHDRQFIDRQDFSNWRAASPRLFAQKYFKCFDFFRVLIALTAPASEFEGFRGKPIWLTEFGLGTKLMGAYNEPDWQHVPFIRPRRIPAEALPRSSAIWEDIWNSFLATVNPEYLRGLGIRAMFFYSLRETQVSGLDKHDDDRTNFAILHRDGSPRMNIDTFNGLQRFIHKMTGRDFDPWRADFSLPPDWLRSQIFSLPLLRSAPWRYLTAPDSVFGTLSMLSDDEKRFLYWSTKVYYTGAGAIVDAGCFSGGSTVALATGLVENWPEDRFAVDSYDRFLADDYMRQFYFKERAPQGARFRNIFDEETAAIAAKVRVHDGDITTFGWDGRPVEILFLDVCKSWELNEYCMATFFPRLIPGQSLVIQQDFFHFAEEWLIASMELLWEKFDYVGHVLLNTAVFRLRESIAPDQVPVNLRGLGLERLEALIRRHADRHDDPFRKGMVLSALAKLYLEFGEQSKAEWAARAAIDIANNDFWVVEGVRSLGLA